MTRPRSAAARVAALAVAVAVGVGACGDPPPAPPAPAPAAEPSFYPSLLPFGRGDVALDRAVREGRPAMILFTDDG